MARCIIAPNSLLIALEMKSCIQCPKHFKADFKHFKADFSYLKNYSFIVRNLFYLYELSYESIDLICKHYTCRGLSLKTYYYNRHL